MNPMFLSFLKSMQTKSQDAQNPGLWVNGNRMPVQEGTFNMLPPKGPERDKVVAAEQAAKAGKSKNEQDDDMIIPDTVKNNPMTDHSDRGKYNLRGYAPESEGPIGGYKPSGRSVRPVVSPQPNATPMQENTNRSMFLTHLQGMQTKSQNAQNPGLWVNGNRMPVQESLLGSLGKGLAGSLFKRPARYGDAGPARPSPGGRLPGLINPKPKSPTEITVDDIINPNTGNVSLSTGEANKPGAVTLHPEGQNILNPPAKSKSGLLDIIDRPGLPKRTPDLMRPGTYGGGERRPNLDVIGGPDDPYAPGGSKTRESKDRIDYLLKKRGNSREPLGIIPPTDPNLMNRMY